jgi:hypothetical protein
MSSSAELSRTDNLIERIRTLESKKSKRRLVFIVIPLLFGVALLAVSAVFLEQKLIAQRALIQRLEEDSVASGKARHSQIQQLEAQVRQLGELQKKISELETTNALVKPPTNQVAEVKTTAAEFEDKTKLTLLAQRFIGALAANNPQNLQDIFADKVDYYEFGMMTRSQIQKDLDRDRIKWPIRTFTISGDIQYRKLPGRSWEISFPVEYILLNEQRQPATGSLKITLTCEEPTLRITAVRREILKAKKPGK